MNRLYAKMNGPDVVLVAPRRPCTANLRRRSAVSSKHKAQKTRRQAMCRQCGKSFMIPISARRITCSAKCHAERKKSVAKEYLAKHAEKNRQRARQHYWDNRESKLKSLRRKYASSPKFRERAIRRSNESRKRRKQLDPVAYKRFWRDRYLRKAYGVDHVAYDELFRRQKGKCAICGTRTAINGASHELFVDHDHATGMIRGLLCMQCNRGVGSFRDNPALLRSAAEYLEVSNATRC
jgi:hypothetical protein